MVLDNTKIHHAKLLEDFLEENSRLQLAFLPPYSPNSNKIEELWRWFKDSVINNVFFHTRDEIREAVRGFVEWIKTMSDIVTDRLCL